MSNAALNWAWGIRGIPQTAKLVLVRLADRADKQGYCHPGYSSLAQECCLSRSAVARALAWLEQAEIVTVERGVKESNRYLLRTSSSPLLVARRYHPSSGEGLGVVAEKDSTSSGEGHEPTVTHNLNPKRTLNMPLRGFDLFWKDYPLKKGKGQAERAWNKLKGGDLTVELILRAIQSQLHERQILSGRMGVDGRPVFVPPWKHPGTWLNGRCWEDQVDTTLKPEETTAQKFQRIHGGNGTKEIEHDAPSDNEQPEQIDERIPF